jgi:hypothetical protein
MTRRNSRSTRTGRARSGDNLRVRGFGTSHPGRHRQWRAIGPSQNIVDLVVRVVHSDNWQTVCTQGMKGVIDRDFRKPLLMGSMSFSCLTLKQLLKIKTFVGTSENAVQIQIWTALIAMLLLKYMQLKARFGWSLSNLVALLRQQLFVYRDLWRWLNCPFEAPPIPEKYQLELAFSTGAGD